MVRETVKLIKTIKKMYPVLTFFKDRYFPDGQVYYSEKALIETKRKGKMVAPFVVPVVGNIVMEDEGYRTYEIDAPYIAPSMTITAKELEKKAFGESPESGRTPEQRENEIESEHMDDLRKSIYRRQELMCSDIINTGEVLMKHFSSSDDAVHDKNYSLKVLRFYDGTFGNRYKFSGYFLNMTAQEKLQEFYRISSILRKRGIRATDIVMTADVSMVLMTDEKFLDYYDKAKVEMGDINQTELPEGVVCNGRININGVVMTMFTYDETYEDLDGSEKEIFPKGTIAFLHPNLGETVYAQVTLMENGRFRSYAQRIVPRLVPDEDNNLMSVQTFSRPVPYPYDWDSWLVGNIYDTEYSNEADTVSTYASDTDVSENASEPSLKTADEINAMTTKAPLIEYANSIGLTTLTDASSLADLKSAILEYQEQTYGADTL